MKPAVTILDRIMVDVRREAADAQRLRPISELRRMISDAPPLRPFQQALVSSFGLIAEIKERSPSQGEMRRENVVHAARAYERSGIVRCISVLTNTSHFGMNIRRLREVKVGGTKPVLRKDFIFDEHQVYEARAFGADAILLMANLLEAGALSRLFDLGRELGLEALFECHDEEQIRRVPTGAEIFGINSRTFSADSSVYEAAKQQRLAGASQDFSTDLSRFALGRQLPANAVKVAESGVHPRNIASIREQGIYHAVLVGTSLLTAAHGVEAELGAFESALAAAPGVNRR